MNVTSSSAPKSGIRLTLSVARSSKTNYLGMSYIIWNQVVACWGNSREDLYKGKHLVDWSDKKKKAKSVETRQSEEGGS